MSMSLVGDEGYLAAIRTSQDPTQFVVLLEDTAALIGMVKEDRHPGSSSKISRAAGAAYSNGNAAVAHELGTAARLARKRSGRGIT
jgi:hypothetical protein